MADGLTLNPAAGGATLLTDDTGAGGHAQVMKLAISADGSGTLIPADATNGIKVDVARVGGNVTVVGAAADGAAASGNPVLVAGFDGTNAQSISTTAGGLVQIHDAGGSITVDGTVTANLGTIGSAATETTVAAVSTAIGAKTDDKSTATDTTSVSAISIWKQISASVQAIASSVAGTLTVATHAVTQSGTWNVGTVTTITNVVHVDDNSSTLSVDDGAGSLTVDGTVTVNAGTNLNTSALALESGGNLAAVNTVLGAKADAKSTATDTTSISAMQVWKQISASVQAIATSVAGTLTVGLPSGASTAAKQPALGTAGSASADVLTVQGVTSMTPLLVNGSGVTQPVSDAGGSLTVDGTVGVSGTVAVTDNSGSLTVDAPVGTPVFVRLSDGASPITALPITDNSGSITVDGTFWQATQPVSGTVSITANSAVNVAQINGVAATMGNGASGTGVQRVTIASDSTGQVALAAGTNVIGKELSTETTLNATIAIGTSTTVQATGSDLRGYRLQGLVVPSTFDGTTITFQVSADNSTYQVLYDRNNTQVSMTVAASRSYDTPGELASWPYAKIVCGTAQTTTDTVFVWVLKS